jgi:hypothetical protein
MKFANSRNAIPSAPRQEWHYVKDGFLRYIRRGIHPRGAQCSSDQMLMSQAAEVFTATPEEFGALMARDIVRLGKVVRESGARGSDSKPGGDTQFSCLAQLRRTERLAQSIAS